MTEHADHGERLAALEATLRALHLNMDANFKAVLARQDRTNGAIADLNRFRYLSIGALSVITFLVSVFGATTVALAVSELSR